MFQTILAALKFTPTSLRALEFAAKLAAAHGAKLHVFHALDYKLSTLDPADPKCRASCLEAEKAFKEQAEQLLQGVGDWDFDCRPADAGMEICRLATRLEAGLVVLGCHQRSGIGLGRMDYTGMTIMEKSPCPVTLVPYQPEKETSGK